MLAAGGLVLPVSHALPVSLLRSLGASISEVQGWGDGNSQLLISVLSRAMARLGRNRSRWSSKGLGPDGPVTNSTWVLVSQDWDPRILSPGSGLSLLHGPTPPPVDPSSSVLGEASVEEVML